MPFTKFLEKRPSQNAINATIQFIKKLKTPVTVSSVIESLEQHPDYPSMLSIVDSLKEWGIKNLALEATPENLEKLPVPFLAHTRKDGGNFLVVLSVNGVVKWIDENGREQTKSKEDFVKDWTGVALLAEPDEHSGQKNYRAIRRREILDTLRIPSVVIASLLLVVLYAITQPVGNSLWLSLLLLLKLTGCLVTGLLLWFEIDKANPILRQICSAGKNTNCTAVLGSKESKLFGVISWSEIGFFYFAGGFLYILLTANQQLLTFSLLSWLNLLALPYTIFSIYYQWHIAKQWCRLCLAVQALLVLEFTVIFFGYWHSGTLQYLFFAIPKNYLLPLLSSFLLPVFFWIITKKVYLNAHETGRYKKDLFKLKHNGEIFTALLQKQRKIIASPEGLGITLGNPNAANTIVKVCSPYCSPCARAHDTLDKILEDNEDVKVQIIFMATNNENDQRAMPVKHFMAIHEKKDTVLIKNALNDWYNSEPKDYETFREKYSLKDELLKQGEKLEEMEKWCKETGISFTPTFFINGYQLPEIYKIEDVKYLL